MEEEEERVDCWTLETDELLPEDKGCAVEDVLATIVDERILDVEVVTTETIFLKESVAPGGGVC